MVWQGTLKAFCEEKIATAADADAANEWQFMNILFESDARRRRRHPRCPAAIHAASLRDGAVRQGCAQRAIPILAVARQAARRRAGSMRGGACDGPACRAITTNPWGL